MRVIGLALLGTLALGCGGEPEAPAAATEPTTTTSDQSANQAPVIRSAGLMPSSPYAGDTLTLGIKAIDPDGDRIDLTVEWFRNGQPVQKSSRATLETRGFVRGDSIYAALTASDGLEAASFQTDPVTLVNQPPQVTRIQVLPEKPNAANDLTAVAEGGDGDRDEFEFSYQWYVKGRKLAGATEPTLEKGKFKRGDKVQVEVSARDSYDTGKSVRSTALKIPNGAPKITSDPEQATVSGGRYKYVMKAEDPDRDRPLRYQLVDGPKGMNVDLLSGAVTWKVPKRAGGDFPVELSVTDPLGGESRQSYTVELHWETEPADTP